MIRIPRSLNALRPEPVSGGGRATAKDWPSRVKVGTHRFGYVQSPFFTLYNNHPVDSVAIYTRGLNIILAISATQCLRLLVRGWVGKLLQKVASDETSHFGRVALDIVVDAQKGSILRLGVLQLLLHL